MATHDERSIDGFLSFFRGYTKTWIHAVAAAGLTAFGTLSVYHRGFIAIALAAYVAPPIVLYLWRPSAGRDDADAATPREPEPTAGARAATGEVERPGAAAEAGDGDGPDDVASGPDDGRPDDTDDGAGQTDAARTIDRPREWRSVDVPTESTLRDVCVTDGGAAHAVGEDGVVLSAAGVDAEWAVALADGPAAQGEELQGVDATADGEAVWVAGDSGALGRLEPEAGLHTDYTAPLEITNNWLGVAVAGRSGDETILLIDGSGAVCRGRYRDGEMAWDEPVTPGSGSSLSGVALADASVGYCCDTNDAVFETTDGGASFDGVGPVGAGGTLEAVATLGRGDCLVSADDGVVHRYGGSTWTPERVGEEAICGLARREGETIACDADGAIYERSEGDWTAVDAGPLESLIGVAVAPDGRRAVAVGDEGTVVERR
ncbi:hypothetical protein A6E15_01240 [Natrinema saccharevitans]|uniref:Uncharacterized protein n=1 Tax=Natrinema saccharevitans TaxID=301967 RepID=A0A1S8ASK4_9EURY|nr:hypothetical protein [Natrinema saccharevitans]OLZ39690.1 hypothetical protein A6E15_01240 [Natrinema saccharevitans]